MARRLLLSGSALLTIVLAVLLLCGSAAGLSPGNGGWQWQNPLPQGGGYASGYFLDAGHGWLISGGTIFHTSDGGLTLTVQARHNVTFRAITFVGASHGWAVGYPAGRKRYGDPLPHHQRRRDLDACPAEMSRRIGDVSFATTQVGWATSSTPSCTPPTAAAPGPRRCLLRHQQTFAVQALSARQAWVAAPANTLLRTVDGGATWRRHSAPAWP